MLSLGSVHILTTFCIPYVSERIPQTPEPFILWTILKKNSYWPCDASHADYQPPFLLWYISSVWVKLSWMSNGRSRAVLNNWREMSIMHKHVGDTGKKMEDDVISTESSVSLTWFVMMSPGLLSCFSCHNHSFPL